MRTYAYILMIKELIRLYSDDWEVITIYANIYWFRLVYDDVPESIYYIHYLHLLSMIHCNKWIKWHNANPQTP